MFFASLHAAKEELIQDQWWEDGGDDNVCLSQCFQEAKENKTKNKKNNVYYDGLGKSRRMDD